MINKVLLVGNAGRDAELKVTSGGKNYATFSLATSERYQGHDGQWRENTTWHKIKVMGRSSVRAAETVKRGDCVLVEGSYESYEHENKTFFEVKCWSYKLVTRKDTPTYPNETLTPSETSTLDPWRTTDNKWS